MKKFIYLLILVFVVSCDNSDDNNSDDNNSIENSSVGIPTLDATGTLAEQTVEEAKKVIYGKWSIDNGLGITGNVNGSKSKSVNFESSSLNSNTCEFDYIEFTDDHFLMGFIFNEVPQAVFGIYTLNEDSNGFVSSVDLFIDESGSELKIATLTDVVVTESSTELTATFTIELSIPEEYAEYQVCNNLQGDYNAQKEVPMDESYTEDENSNHALFVNDWVLESIVDSNGQDLTLEYLSYPCYFYDETTYEEAYLEGCSPASDLYLSVSTFGTYTFAYVGSSEGTDVEVDTWAWTDSTQTAFYVNDGYEIVSVVSLTESKGVFSTTDDYEDITLFYTFRSL